VRKIDLSLSGIPIVHS